MTSYKNKIIEIERIIDLGVSTEERNGPISVALNHYLDAKERIGNLTRENKLDAETTTKLKKYIILINDRIQKNNDPSKGTKHRSVFSPSEFITKYSSYLRNYDKKFIEEISFNIMQPMNEVKFDDIAGNNEAKSVISECVILPILKPELFQGLRKPARGILLYGPPGNGKTLLAKAIANQCQATFFCISAANLMSKWVGESEKLVSTLFACARVASPAIIFIDEVDALLSSRDQGSNQVQFRLLTQFLQEVNGVQSGEQQLLVLAATNHPEILDDAALRRFPRRIYIGMPDSSGRLKIIELLIKKEKNIIFSLQNNDIRFIVANTEGYSSSDLTELVKDAAMGPIRGMKPEKLLKLRSTDLRPVDLNDFKESLQRIRPSVDQNSLKGMLEWRSKYGDQINAKTEKNGSGFFSNLFTNSTTPSPADSSQKNVIYRPSSSS